MKLLLIIDSDIDLDGWYGEYQVRLVAELRAAARPEE